MKSIIAVATPAVLLLVSLLGELRGTTGLIIREGISNSTGLRGKNSAKQLSNTLREFSNSSQAPWLFFDFGFFDGTDSLSYLNQGYRVVAVEADPSLVLAGGSSPQLAPFIAQGKLVILNYAIALGDAAQVSMTTFYLNKCSKEWNSFKSDVGCRSCTPPHPEDLTKASCTATQVQSQPCMRVFQEHGMPVYLKADMEGAEANCYKALEAYPVDKRPPLISGEVNDDNLVNVFANLGYTSFKIVKQASGHSGGWGDYAQDCRLGGVWRSQASADAELKKLMDKANPQPATDLCPSIVGGFGTWYDVHASRMPPQA